MVSKTRQRIAAAPLAILLLTVLWTFQTSAQTDKTEEPTCTSSGFHQFDFWVGDWDAYDASDSNRIIARNRVERILNGCVIREDYDQFDGLHGQSFNTYDSSTGLWRQSWVTNRGSFLLLEGSLHDGMIVLEATEMENGRRTFVRGTWKQVEGGVRETAVKSTDERKTWTPWFDVIFRPHRESIDSYSRDRKILSDLDEKYQSAVKSGNAATMDLILANEFVLVTGSGKTYTKADLLNDARQKTETYEHQEDTNRTVRVFGDTAVVTAKLWEKGISNNKPFDYTVWFSDTYIRTSGGWRYVFGQSSLPLPPSTVAGH